ncbi:cysteine dioxygenase type 1 isoform X2 [Colius striatus]|uniref:cysteine dioxygenase type 1 isoform X2 n=1 Tax=Colius striatus TaxID=57412 RepID=UPI002B1D8D58|nr:cysteine dioxygenase type 1 isoform X2 [Colius striatus]
MEEQPAVMEQPVQTEVWKPQSLEELVRILHRIFAEDKVSVEEVQELMESYESNPEEWLQYAKFDQYSSIHDHTDSHCFMKILQGNLKETLFQWPEKKGNGEMTKKSERVLRDNQCAYINDSIGLHRVENISHTETAVSLHLYSPPFDSCNTFDQRTGHKHKVKMTFYSQFGERTACATAVPQENN